jgi:hypothetical protein
MWEPVITGVQCVQDGMQMELVGTLAQDSHGNKSLPVLCSGRIGTAIMTIHQLGRVEIG